jgi:hypothetical protein
MSTNKARTQEYLIHLRFSHTTKVLYSSLRSPQMARSSNPKTPLLTTKVKAIPYSSMLKERVIQTCFSGSSIKLETLKQPQTVKECEVSKETNPHKLMRVRERERVKSNHMIDELNLTPNVPQINERG